MLEQLESGGDKDDKIIVQVNRKVEEWKVRTHTLKSPQLLTFSCKIVTVGHLRIVNFFPFVLCVNFLPVCLSFF